MGWLDYYRLYEIYGDDLSVAPMRELDIAKARNPNDWQSAWKLAKKKWQEHKEQQHEFPQPRWDEGCVKCGGFEGEPCEPPMPSATPDERQLAYVTPKIEQLKAEGYKVTMFTPYHVRINDELEVYMGKRGCCYKPVGQNRKPRDCQGLLHIVHNWFGQKGKGIAAASFRTQQ